MAETIKGFKADIEKIKRRAIQRIFRWFINRIAGKKYKKSSLDILWGLIDEENKKENPDCAMIEAWELAANRISEECMWAC